MLIRVRVWARVRAWARVRKLGLGFYSILISIGAYNEGEPVRARVRVSFISD
jgi:hypothetical protein